MVPKLLKILAALILSTIVSACTKSVSCTDNDVDSIFLEKVKNRAIEDLATKCQTELYRNISGIKSCPSTTAADRTCPTDCEAWAKSSLVVSASEFKTVFSDETVGTKRCSAVTKFEVNYEGGQKVSALLMFIIAPGGRQPQVALSE